MVTIQDTELREGILIAIERAKAISAPVLVSEVHKIDHLEPLLFYAAGRELFLGERFFWKDPVGEQYLSGLGICKQIQTDQSSDRFFHVEREWKRFIESALIYNDFDVNGTGPAMFGGFSFDPIKNKTLLWSKFSESLFHIPKYMLSVIKGQAYFTTNILCTQHDDTTLFEKTAKERQSILERAQSSSFMTRPQLLYKEEVNPDQWKASVRDVVTDLKQDGPLKKVVLARELRLHFNDEVLAEGVLSHLLTEQSDSFVFAFESNGDCFIGASPERLVKKEGEHLFTACLAGSIARGKTPKLDKALGESLLKDQKNIIEHQYVVDMIKEAMSETCDEVILPEQPKLMKMRDIQHLYTPVLGINRKNSSLLDIVERLHPTPALGGLPKEAAVKKIREVERLDRGFYAAPIGWLDYRDSGEFAVAIRSGLLQGNEASLFAGCGVVADSDAESEYKETNIKFRPMLTALGGK
ncbi:isochorismate synthase [Mesobacillus harenae]|uniref:isochorismate synthase n=1 Tax=Mesobacillus harenae TaxID=2213203 RepID=UPI00157FC4AF|nr:isochorismate synthase [Mesobacillus harenae]